MPRISAKSASPSPVAPPPVHEVPPPRAVKRSAPQHVGVADAPVEVPRGAESWGIEDSGGVQLGAMNVDAVEIYEWPISLFTVDNIRRQWGPGRYKARFKNAKGQSHGRKGFALGALNSTVADEETAPAHVATAHPVALAVSDDPIARGLQLMTALNGIANQQASAAIERDRQFLQHANEQTQAMFAAAMGREQQVARQARADAPPW